MIWPRMLNQLKRHEGCKRDPQTGYLLPYKDSLGIWTGGYGYNFESHGIEPFQMTETTAVNLLMAEALQAVRIAETYFPTFDSLNDARQEVLVNMAYTMGHKLEEWPRLRAAVTAGDWHKAAESITASKYARQTKGRAVELAEQMETGDSKEPIPPEGA